VKAVGGLCFEFEACRLRVFHTLACNYASDTNKLHDVKQIHFPSFFYGRSEQSMEWSHLADLGLGMVQLLPGTCEALGFDSQHHRVRKRGAVLRSSLSPSSGD
jgi:hypothetical protein